MSPPLIDQFRKDEDYAPYLKDEFDTQAHTSSLIQGVVVTEHLSKLSTGISKLEKEIEIQVGSHYDDLLAHTSGITKLENVLETMDNRIETLLAGVGRVRSRIVEPYDRIKNQTLILERLQKTCELSRRVSRYLSLSQRLHDQMQNYSKDITKAASSLRELDELGSDSDLNEIQILEDDHKFIKQSRINVEKHAVLIMEQGLEKQNQTQVGTALQVFYNLGILNSSVDSIRKDLINGLKTSAQSALDVDLLNQSVQKRSRDAGVGPGGAMIPISGKNVNFRANLWTGLEKLMEDVFTVCQKVSHLYKVLSKKRDSVTHVCFLHEIFNGKKSDLFSDAWESIISILTKEFSKSVSGSNYIRQALEVDYPKLLRLFGDLCKKLDIVGKEVSSVRTSSICDNNELQQLFESISFDPETSLRSSIVALEKAYVSRSLSRLFDGVNLMFSSNMVPSKEEIDSLVKTIVNELTVSSFDKNLSGTVARNVVKTLQVFCQKCEHLLVTGGDASQVIGTPTAGQKLNVNIVNQLLYLSNQIERTASGTLAHLPTVVTETLLGAIPTIHSQISASIDPLFSSLHESIEAIILTMHKEDFSSNTIDKKDKQCSLYMKELQSFISRSHTDYLAPFHPSPVVSDRINKLACSCLDIFVRHASIMRPLGEGGKTRLAADFSQLESAILPLSNRPSDLGRSYRILRSFRPLFFETVEQIVSTPSIGDVIPYSVVLHFLFARAPAEMKSPHETAGWSPTRYSSWLDDHSCERERLELIQGALESYVAGVRSRHETEFASIYPHMVKLLQEGLQYWSTRQEEN